MVSKRVYARIAMYLVLLALLMTGVFGSQYKNVEEGESTTAGVYVYLYKQIFGPVTTYYASASKGCTARYDTVKAAFAMGVLACIGIVCVLVVTGLRISDPRHRILTLCSQILPWVVAVFAILSSILASVFFDATFCDESVPFKDVLDVDYGYAFLLGSTVAVCVWAVVEVVLDRFIPEGSSPMYQAI